GVAGGEDQCRFGAEEIGQLVFASGVFFGGAGYQAGFGRPGAVAVEPGGRAVEYLLMGGQAQVVVGGQVDPLPAPVPGAQVAAQPRPIAVGGAFGQPVGEHGRVGGEGRYGVHTAHTTET